MRIFIPVHTAGLYLCSGVSALLPPYCLINWAKSMLSTQISHRQPWNRRRGHPWRSSRIDCPTAGEAVKFAVRGTGLPDSSRATDGWKFWHTVDPATGKLAMLRETRRKAALETK